MKQFLIVGLMAMLATMVAANADAQTCMYCRRMDRQETGLINTYSYCNQSDSCQEDLWNYINKGCISGWERGQSYDIDYCNAEKIECENFVSSTEKYQLYENTTKQFERGQYCTFTVDASEGVARVILTQDDDLLGIDYKNYGMGDVITIPQGEKAELLIYNGSENKAIKAIVSFSGATQTIVSSLAAFALSYLAF